MKDMACDCGSPWGKVIDDKLVCPKCGRTKDVKITYEQLAKENKDLKEIINHKKNSPTK